MDKYVRKLTIQLNIKELDADKIRNLKDLISMHPGSHLLDFVVYDNREQIKLEMPSRKQKVKVTQELLSALEEDQVLYKLNT
jgi:DNA polymerase-3 subunit alpha